ncbi:MAG: response regulator [Candidatus Omnitrophica bacterium]|nr:response regulator [Candidatus Omnitrophota bacterium]
MKKKKILVVEDRESLQDVLKSRLQEAGYQVSIASTGAQGLKAVTKMKPDLIILDVMLPDANGFDLCQKIKEMKRPFKVIIYTGKLEAVDVQHARQVGADDFTVKTIDFKYLLASVAKLTA